MAMEPMVIATTRMAIKAWATAPGAKVKVMTTVIHTPIGVMVGTSTVVMEIMALPQLAMMMTVVKTNVAVNAVVTTMVDMVDMATAMVDMDMENTLVAEMPVNMATQIIR